MVWETSSITSVLYEVMIWYSFEANLLYISNGQCMLIGDLKNLPVIREVTSKCLPIIIWEVDSESIIIRRVFFKNAFPAWYRRCCYKLGTATVPINYAKLCSLHECSLRISINRSPWYLAWPLKVPHVLVVYPDILAIALNYNWGNQG